MIRTSVDDDRKKVDKTEISLKESKIIKSHVSPKGNIGFEQLGTESPQLQPLNESSYESISLIYKPVVCIYRLAGVCPISIEEKADGGISYSFTLSSRITFVSIVASCVVIFLYMTWLGKLLSPLKHLLKPNETNSDVDDNAYHSFVSKSVLTPLLSRILPLQLPINTSINIIASLTSIPKFAYLLEMWSQFERDFQSRLPSSKPRFATLRRSRNKLAMFYFLFGSIYGFMVIFVTRPKCFNANSSNCSQLRHLVGGLVVFPYAMYTFMEDFKFLLMFRTVEEGFRQVCILKKFFDIHVIIRNLIEITKPHVSIEVELYNELGKRNGISRTPLPDIVLKWQELVHDLRRLTRIVSECSSVHHVVAISTTFFSVLVGIYLSVLFQFTSNVEKTKGGITIVAMGFSAVGFSRCLIKTNGSERILRQEKLIVDQLSVVKTGDDFKTQIKINALVDLIGREPSQITILNSFNLNTSFFFQIIGQIATYLIVLLQFDKI